MTMPTTPVDRSSQWTEYFAELEAAISSALTCLARTDAQAVAEVATGLNGLAHQMDRVFCASSGNDLRMNPQDLGRLEQIRARLLQVQNMAREAVAFYRGIEQLNPDVVIGYRPGGLERTR